MKQPIEYLKNNLISLLGEIDEDEWKILVQEQSEDGFFINACLKSMDEYISKEALIKYSEFLEQNGYLDSDWRDEGSAVDRFLETVPMEAKTNETRPHTPKPWSWSVQDLSDRVRELTEENERLVAALESIRKTNYYLWKHNK